MNKKIIIVFLAIFMLIAMGAGCKCKKESPENTQGTAPEDEQKPKEKNYELYSWSRMDQGPYNDKISFATSADLLNWNDSEKILAEHASVPGAVYKDGVIYVYFVDVSEEGLPEQLGFIKSTDEGKSWFAKHILEVKGIGDKVIADPDPVLIENGKIRLYYFDISQRPDSANPNAKNDIYSAISDDGINFVQEDGVRFAENAVFDPDVERVGDTWHMYVGDVEGNKVISATSSDGLNFQKEGIAYEGGAVPDVFYKDNTYYLYTAGIDISISQDGKSFIKTDNFFNTSRGTITADPSVVQLKDGSYLMLYKYKE